VREPAGSRWRAFFVSGHASRSGKGFGPNYLVIEVGESLFGCRVAPDRKSAPRRRIKSSQATEFIGFPGLEPKIPSSYCIILCLSNLTHLIPRFDTPFSSMQGFVEGLMGSPDDRCSILRRKQPAPTR
jgi:hypothetical protein